MKNIYGNEVREKDIKNTILIAKDLQFYGYNFKYFYENYTNLLTKDDSKNLWNKALELNIV